MNHFVEIVGAPVVILSVLLDVRSVLSSPLALQIIWVFLVPLLLELIVRDLSVSVHAIAARRAVENLAATLCTSVMAAALVMEANTSGSALLLVRVRSGRLHISCITEHRHLDANLGNALVLLVVVDRSRSRANGTTRSATLFARGSVVLWRQFAEACGGGLVRVGACYGLNVTLRG